LVRTAALSAADERRARFVDGLEELMREAELSLEEGEVGSFNVLKALQRAEPPIAAGRETLSRLLARGVALEPPDDAEEATRLAEALSWLSAHSYLDGLSWLDSELSSEDAERLWTALAGTIRAVDERGAPAGRAEALAAASALAASKSESAQAIASALRRDLGDPLLNAAFGSPVAAPAADSAASSSYTPSTSLRGKLVLPPLGPVALVLWCATGLIVLRYALRFVGNVLLRCKRPTEVRVAGNGVTVSAQLDVMGRTVRKKQTLIPLEGLARAEREVRYPRLPLYAGLIALALGSYVGVMLLTDAARAGSPQLLALGAVVFGVGVVCDLVFSSVWRSRPGRYVLVFVPRKGRVLAVETDDQHGADAALDRLASAAR
jgi:hypothetical protein